MVLPAFGRLECGAMGPCEECGVSCVGQSGAKRGGRRALDAACPVCTAARSGTSSRWFGSRLMSCEGWFISESPPGVVSYLASPSQQHGTLV